LNQESLTSLSQNVDSLKEDLNELSQVSRNLWPFEQSVSFTRYKYYKPGGILLNAGTYRVSAIVTSDGTAPTARIAFDNESGTQISYGNVTMDSERRYSNVITLSEDCYAIWLFSQNASSTSVGVSATWTNIQIESGSDVTDYVSHISAKDTVLQKRVEDIELFVEDKMYGAGHLLPNAVGIEALGFLTPSDNLFNYDDPKNQSGYVNFKGKISPNENWKTSWYIEVEPSTIYYIGGVYNNGSVKNLRYYCELDGDLNPVNYNSDLVTNNIITSATTKYIRFSYNSSFISDRIYIGRNDWDGINAPKYNPIIPNKYINAISNKEDNTDSFMYTKYYSVIGDMTDGTYLKDENTANSIRSNERIIFNSDITSFDSLEIGFAWYSTNYKYNRFIIDNTNLTIYNYIGTAEVIPHGLTIVNNIQVLIESNFMRTCNITIISNGALFKAEGKALDRRRVCFAYAQSVGSILPNAKITWTCIDFDKPIWIFGDSYVASWTDKWVKYLYQYGYVENCLFDAFPGEDSSESIQSLQHLLTIAKPKKIIWCLGMNDGTDEDAPSTRWATAQDALRELCGNNNIQLMLATIPTVPTINHEKKNANVRSSGYRYIDFAKAVGASSTGVWYGNGTTYDMLSADGIHPSDYGAKALFGRVLIDVPEIMITP